MTQALNMPKATGDTLRQTHRLICGLTKATQMIVSPLKTLHHLL